MRGRLAAQMFMTLGPDKKPIETTHWKICRVKWSHPSARILLTFLFWLSLNVVACYDWALSKFVRLTRPLFYLSSRAMFSLTHSVRRCAEAVRTWTHC